MLSKNCWCALHFKGSMDKGRNPEGIHQCMINSLAVVDCDQNPEWGPYLKTHSCPCFISKKPGEGCIFGDMRPAKILAVVSLARKLGVTHIIEEGRYGGLTAYIYSLLGFKVTSIEYVPLDDVTDSLTQLAPAIRQITGDGHVVTPQTVDEAPTNERLAVIFDGTKRHDAYDTSWLKVKSRVAFGVFDDTNVPEPFPYVKTKRNGGDLPDSSAKRRPYGFDSYLKVTKRETIWNSNRTNKAILQREMPHVKTMLQSIKKAGLFSGSMQNLDKSQFTIVQGGQWEKPGCVSTANPGKGIIGTIKKVIG